MKTPILMMRPLEVTRMKVLRVGLPLGTLKVFKHLQALSLLMLARKREGNAETAKRGLNGALGRTSS